MPIDLEELERRLQIRGKAAWNGTEIGRLRMSADIADSVPALIAEVRRLHRRLPSAEELEAIAAAASAYDSDYNGAVDELCRLALLGLERDERQAVTSEQAAKDIKILEQIHAKSWDEAVALRHAAEALSERDERAERIGRAVLETFEQAMRAFFDDPESPPLDCATFQRMAENAAFDLDEAGRSFGLVAARILLAIADEMEERGG